MNQTVHRNIWQVKGDINPALPCILTEKHFIQAIKATEGNPYLFWFKLIHFDIRRISELWQCLPNILPTISIIRACPNLILNACRKIPPFSQIDALSIWSLHIQSCSCSAIPILIVSKARMLASTKSSNERIKVLINHKQLIVCSHHWRCPITNFIIRYR